GQAILAPPFGLQWGDSPDKVLDWADAKKLDATINMKGATPALYIVRVSSAQGPLPGHPAYALETRYHWGKLFEVTVHYGAPGMKAAKVRVDFDKLKTAMTVKHGPFTPSNKQEKKGDGFIRRSVSYHREPVKGLLLMMSWTEVEDTLRKKRSARFSLLYRNQNIIPK
ncbi:MAG: hypothetical protein KJO79_08390, partial [Verrucomicrobiae bacterium]|nr:hypothetical protein [Verrucomicrobiae bacterium]NNJ87185.1 hypothetical protein [Akkermansiaceae bacterium]